jgi:uncharacterized SAM-binding protein YcdF (DUF218 family)
LVRANPVADVWLVAVGGGAPPESQRIRAHVVAAGVADARVLEEPESRSTCENAIRTVRLLRARGLAERRIWLVTDRSHLPRAWLCFALTGLIARPMPVADGVRPSVWLREAAALLAYLRHVPALRAEARRG